MLRIILTQLNTIFVSAITQQRLPVDYEPSWYVWHWPSSRAEYRSLRFISRLHKNQFVIFLAWHVWSCPFLPQPLCDIITRCYMNWTEVILFNSIWDGITFLHATSAAVFVCSCLYTLPIVPRYDADLVRRQENDTSVPEREMRG